MTNHPNFGACDWKGACYHSIFVRNESGKKAKIRGTTKLVKTYSHHPCGSNKTRLWERSWLVLACQTNLTTSWPLHAGNRMSFPFHVGHTTPHSSSSMACPFANYS
ncbi:hypothetical protein LIA77_00005 [Sarocladium implicatum]|nr:hypothetical protein LIA77_00005 [Sarocladium implicatum]